MPLPPNPFTPSAIISHHQSEGSRFEDTARQPRAAEKIALHDTPQRMGLCRGNIHRETHTLTAGGMVAKVVQRLEEREQWG